MLHISTVRYLYSSKSFDDLVRWMGVRSDKHLQPGADYSCTAVLCYALPCHLLSCLVVSCPALFYLSTDIMPLKKLNSRFFKYT